LTAVAVRIIHTAGVPMNGLSGASAVVSRHIHAVPHDDLGSSVRSFARSRALLESARTLIPGGYHLSGRPLLSPDNSPMYFERGRGSRVWDVDGHEYIDFVMAYGPMLLGYAHEEVDLAAFEQARRGNLLSLNHPLHLRFVERLIARLPGAEMGAFFKTSSRPGRTRPPRRYGWRDEPPAGRALRGAAIMGGMIGACPTETSCRAGSSDRSSNFAPMSPIRCASCCERTTDRSPR
jgi:hypothetical protein